MATQSVDIKELLAAGAHFGHKTSKWHPKMSSFIHSKRGDTHIIDLVQTVDRLEDALTFVEKVAATGKQILLVGTKRQAKELVEKTAAEVDMPYVTNRWLGGMLTNTTTINARIKHLKELETKMAAGELASRYSKLEVQKFQEEIDQMNHIFGGIKHMSGKPGAVFVVSMVDDINAVREARRLKIPVIALTDTNADPTLADYPVPCNDDATKAIELVLNHIAKAIEAGRAKVKAPAKPEAK